MTKELKKFIQQLQDKDDSVSTGMSQAFLSLALSQKEGLFGTSDKLDGREAIENWLNSEPEKRLIIWEEITTKIFRLFGVNNISIDTCIYAYLEILTEKEVLDSKVFLEKFFEQIVEEAVANPTVEEPKETEPSVAYVDINEQAMIMETYFPFFRQKAKDVINILIETQRKIPHIISESKFLRSALIHELGNAANEFDCPIDTFPMRIFLVDGKEILSATNNQSDVHSIMHSLFTHFKEKSGEAKIVVLENASFVMSVAGGAIFVKLLSFIRQFELGLITLGVEESPEEVEGYTVDIELDNLKEKDIKRILDEMAIFYLDYHAVDARNQVDFILDLTENELPHPKICSALQLLEYACIKERNEKSNMKALGFTEIVEEIGDDYTKFSEVFKQKQDEIRGRPMRLSQKTVEESAEFLFEIEKVNTLKAVNVAYLEDEMNKTIFGQKEAIKLISESILRAKADLRQRKGPLGVFMALGDSGVGKTFTAKVLQQKMYGTDDIVRLDMSEYSEESSVAKIFGSAAGYVGYDQGSAFLNAVKSNPRSVILVDEIEKAHPHVINAFLHIFDEGTATASNGMKVDFSDTIIIIAGNIGSKELREEAPKTLGFVNSFDPVAFQASRVENARKTLRDKFPPEFLNRMHEIVFYNPLDPSIVLKIIEAKLNEIKEHIKPRGFDLVFSEKTVESLAQKCQDPLHNGARLVDKIIRNAVETPLSKIVLENKKGKIEISGDISFTFAPENSKIKNHEGKGTNKRKSLRTQDAGRTSV